MSLIRCSPLIAGLLFAPLAVAQDAPQVDDDRPDQEQPAEIQQAPESPVVFRQVERARPSRADRIPADELPAFESLVVRGEDGRIVRIEEEIDIVALRRNVLIDDESRERIRPVLREWLADLDQLVIDNLDFLENLIPPDGTPGALDKMDLNDQATVQAVARMMTQLIANGPLTQHLRQNGVLTPEQAQLNENIKSDYLQAVMNEVMAEHQVRQREPQDEDERNRHANTISRYLYGLSAQDAISSYYRQMRDAAPHAGKIVEVMGLPQDKVNDLKPLAARAERADDSLDKRTAVRELLNELNFDQRREFLQRALEIVPEADLLTPDAA